MPVTTVKMVVAAHGSGKAMALCSADQLDNRNITAFIAEQKQAQLAASRRRQIESRSFSDIASAGRRPSYGERSIRAGHLVLSGNENGILERAADLCMRIHKSPYRVSRLGAY